MSRPLHLFEGYGIEIEYMIIDRNSCRIRPVAELLLVDGHGAIVNEVQHGPLSWSNELVRHLVELKTTGPAPSLGGLAALFQSQVEEINALLAGHGCMLLPGATHPFMDPATETKIWEHENTEIYRTFDAIFNCQGHGWSNLQSMHINLPFCGDNEFFRLHNAIRLLLPLIPALSAASPFQGGRDSGFADTRLVHYGKNCARIPEITGLIVPEAVTGADDYQATILEPIYQALTPYDPKKILQEEWVNARGAIARFDRKAIEIRVIDSQECPAADLAIAELICSVVKAFVEKDETVHEAMHRVPTSVLHGQLQQCIAKGEEASIVDPHLAELLGVAPTATGGRFWQNCTAQATDLSGSARSNLETIFTKGTLATRLRRAVTTVDQDSLYRLCRQLATCLQQGKMFG